MAVTDLDTGFERGAARLKTVAATAWRYGLSTSGPVATSGAHFLAALVFVRNLAASEFGIFSFALVIVPFCMSMMAAMLVLPVTTALCKSENERARITAACLKMSWLLLALAFVVLFALLLTVGAPMGEAAVLAGFGMVFACRWLARCLSYVTGGLMAAVTSDWIYAGALICGLGVLLLAHHLSLMAGSWLLLFSAVAALAPFGLKFFAAQMRALRDGALGDYRVIFRDLTKWAVMGVALSEITVNAHAYLVSFLAGPGSFALLAVGTILMRPASLVQSSLPDLERPAMTRVIAARDWKGLARMLNEFRGALIAVWLGAVLLAAALLTWFPELLLKKGYAERDVVMVTIITASIMMARNFRAPLATAMQAAGEFKTLAQIGMRTSLISLAITLALLLALGPIASLGGILAGELALLYLLRRDFLRRRHAHAG